jgi:hypothetical protein
MCLVFGERYLIIQVGPVSLAFAFVCTALQLPDSILDPTFDAGTKMAAEAGEVHEEFKERNVDEDGEEGKIQDEDEAEEVDVATCRCTLVFEQRVDSQGSKTHTKPPDFLIF